MAKRKAPQVKPPLDPESEAWNKIPWRKLEQHCFRIQKRIFRASQRGNTRAVHKLQKLLMKSQAARLLAVRRVTQDNQGKKTAGIDGVKSVKPAGRLAMANHIHPKNWQATSPPVRRVWIPKPGKAEKRPLGIPVMEERARQHLAKLALEPEWEAHFEPNSYGFRPGRSCHDAIEAIFSAIKQKDKYVLDADLKGAFDNINHQALLKKLNTYPAMKRAIQAWLEAGAIDTGVFEATKSGTPQGGTISPLLMNVALHGMETTVMEAFRAKEEKPQFIRYADDLVVFHAMEEGVKRAQTVLETWLADMGLELKPSKTKITHTLKPYQGTVGFEFLGFAIRQFPTGKTHTGKNTWGKPLGFKTIISPSKGAIKTHMQEIGKKIRKLRSASQQDLILTLNPIIRGWANYHRTVVAAKTFSFCDHLVYQQLRRWAYRRHPTKSRQWIIRKYWNMEPGASWVFRDQQEHVLTKHNARPIQRHTKVRGTASPYDGDFLYWSTRLKRHPMLSGTMGKLLQKQQGKCRWCGLLFKDEDQIEIDHITPKSEGGGEELSNKFALHRHCHDQRHARRAATSVHDKDHMIEEPDDANVSRPVLEPSMRSDPHA
ncbi:group II intron reverse transcriptase/maturase [Ktedonobacter sp. SOSP1-85]|uniref:group II intron reverse transcriptase/maturase n=1 Tax=Ktedonobacter sp. SOSP1-85 TaxID=2778367 RepID=UPI001915015F|nr:group II intron reverse transcriptase/maturase [Ktedonobacter sp. SOSP1-85]GHO79123.1 group II intron reverse transcriptase/maturase [Ktedonobacter sp. SOSP1-85]